ncbi:flavin monoamine oxidase family protein [Paracoccus thiocyanatus]|uniref:flavin monoamine oxidase family protein n=1 Tax=Paracoccus thiocyanatus TaxID=34006 RepID=UPI001C6E88FB|nr:FAD-dependent oxidoreductase [Paracoccus thiocyanatus]
MPVLIIGGGLAGLTAAWQLHRAGIDFLLVEARDRLGGRILTAGAGGLPAADGFDLGPSWFWPGMHPGMDRLVAELGLAAFAQAGEGALLFQRAGRPAPERYPMMQQEPASMRLAGGTGAIIAALAARLPADRIRLGTRIARITHGQAGIVAHLADWPAPIAASHVICALPPRLLAAIALDPAPKAATLDLWRGTPTWMAPHAKMFALYDRPFWRDAGLSGAAHSQTGPLVEMHDATTASGKAALFGFVGVPAPHRVQAGRDAVVAASVAQLGQLFGPQALTPLATLYHDWAADPLTATALDQAAGEHPAGGQRDWSGAIWRDRLTLAGSETAVQTPGYLAGAIEAGERAAAKLIRQHANQRSAKQ